MTISMRSLPKFLYFFLSFLFLPICGHADTQVLKWPSNVPTRVCTPSDSNPSCSGGSGASGNVGIGTAGWVAYYPANGSTVTANDAIQFNAGGSVGIGSYNVVSAFPRQLVFGEYQTTGIGRPQFVLNSSANWFGVGSHNAIYGDGSEFRQGPLSDPPSSNWGSLNALESLYTIDSNVGIGTFATRNGRLLIANGDVGIGSAVPQGILDVNGTPNENIILKAGNDPNGSGSGTVNISAGNANSSSSSVGGDVNINAGSANSLVADIGGSVNIKSGPSRSDAGNVNITGANGTGVASDGGNVVLTGGQGTTTDAGTDGAVILNAGGGTGIPGYIQNNGPTYLIGNVGINNNAPQQALDVLGNVFIEDGTHDYLGAALEIDTVSPSGLFMATDPTQRTFLQFCNQNGECGTYTIFGADGSPCSLFGGCEDYATELGSYNSSAPFIFFSGNSTPMIRLGINGESAFGDYNGNISGWSMTTDGSNNWTWNGNGSQLMTLDSSGNQYIPGSLGVGNSAQSKVDITTASDTTSGSPSSFDTEFFTVGSGAANGGNVYISYDQTAGIGYVGSLYPGDSWKELDIRASKIVLSDTVAGGVSTPLNVIDNGFGNVGIGTMFPIGRLEVEGGNVGIGTFKTTTSKLSVIGGNVGIGTWIPSNLFTVGLQKFDVQVGGNVGIGSINPGQLLDVKGTVRANALSIFGGTSSQFLKANGTIDSTTYGAGTVTSITAGTGLTGGIITSSGTINSNAVYQISYQPGLLTSVTGTKSVFGKVSKAATVDNIEGSSYIFSCVSNPTITFYECGVSATCSSSPTTIGSTTVTAAGQVFDGTISSASITAGDYIAWAITSGTCTSLDISATAQVHSN